MKDIWTMKKISLLTLLAAQAAFASDAISIDSIFKKNNGIRSITSLDIITSNNTRTFSSYPGIYSIDDGSMVTETKKAILNETILYGYNSDIDFLINTNFSTEKTTYINSSSSDSSFESLWLGIKYGMDTVFDIFKPDITFQTAVLQNTTYQREDKEHSLKSYNLKYTLRNYSDPLVSSISLSTTQNLKRDIGNKDIKLPDTYALGLDLSLILNPKVSLNMAFDTSYQTKMKEDQYVVNDSTILSTMGFGVTYNINQDNSFTFNSAIGTSANAPDSTISFSLWHKF